MSWLTDPRQLPPAHEIARLQSDLEAVLLGGAGQELGRFTQLVRLGEGGMGIVYRARDPRLEREVAIKLTRIRTGSRAEARMEREAQLLGRLSHPNVLAVHELGDDEHGNLFLVTELVEGQSLAQWCGKRGERTPDDIVEVVSFGLQAARGLAAAHREGLTHRDVKPSNLLIDRDGRVRVSDFGLAILGETNDDAGLESRSDDASVTGRLTGTGVNVGTPAYMAPEQHRGTATPASDQFSWAMSMFEAAYGRRPFDPASLAAPQMPSPVPRPHGLLSRRHHAVLVRALQWDPKARFESMDALVLAWEAASRPWRGSVLGVTAVALSVLGGGVFVNGVRQGDPCAGSAQALAERWNGERRAALVSHFEQVEPGLGASIAARTTADVDAWVRGYREVHRHACEVKDPADASVRNQCLARRAMAFDEALGVLELADSGTVLEAERVVEGLASASACDDPVFLSAIVEPPSSAADAAVVDETRRMLDRSKALVVAGDYAGALALAERAAERAEEVDYVPLAAEVRLRLSLVVARTGAGEESLRLSRESFALAQKADDPKVGFDAAMAIAEGLLGENHKKSSKEALWILDVAEALSPRLGTSEADARQAAIDTTRSAALTEVGDLGGAVALATSALERRAKTQSDSPRLARAYMTQGFVLRRSNDLDGAKEAYTRARALFEATLGPDHPETSNAYASLAAIASERQDYETAEALFDRTIEVLRHTESTSDLRLATALLGRATVHRQRKELPQALAMLDEGLAIFEDHPEADNAHVGMALMTKGTILAATGSHQQSLVALQRALEVFRAAQAPNSNNIVAALGNAARVLEALGRDEDAARALEEAIEIEASSGRGENHMGPRLELQLARIELRLGRWEAGVERLTSIVEQPATSSVSIGTRGRAHLALGHAFAERGELDQARAAMESSIGPLTDAEDDASLAQARAWLEAH